MKRKKTEVAPENPDACLPVSEVKKKKRDDIIDAVDTTEGCTDDELNGIKKSKGGEAASEVKKKKKKKKVKKEKNAHVDIAESADLMERCTNEELDDKKEEKDKNKQPVTTEKDGMEEEEDLEDEEELSPEERRVLERKLKKIRKKEEKMKRKELAMSEKEESKSSIAQTHALEYLTCWSAKREEWKFQKTRQVWLLQNMYDSEKVPDAHFSLLLSYLEGMRGVACEITAQKAEALVRFGTGPEGEGGATEARKRTQRAREVTQILS